MGNKDEYEDDFDDFDDEEDEDDDLEADSEGWMASYSDLVTDLMAVFVLLFSFAMASQSSYVSNLKAQMEAIEPPPSIQESMSEQYREDLVERMRQYMEESRLFPQISLIDRGDNIIILRIPDELLFESGRSTVSEAAKIVLQKISKLLEDNLDYIESVHIEGHTDDVPINTGRFESNWELSADRAVKVLRTLLQFNDFDPAMLAASGYGEYHPIEANDTPEGREKNRRVDFIIALNRAAK